ncbi:MAG: hypothetical protein GY806_18385 [Gammaproteobacteria bacterium]|nr:hypothetical protein [Gammaproteobacteria bacterium]
MTIEIKQMIIKSTLIGNDNEHSDSMGDPVDLESFRESLMEECKALLEANLSEQKER